MFDVLNKQLCSQLGKIGFLLQSSRSFFWLWFYTNKPFGVSKPVQISQDFLFVVHQFLPLGPEL